MKRIFGLILCLVFCGCGGRDNSESPSLSTFYFGDGGWSTSTLWKSDGTEAGTSLVRNFYGGAPSKFTKAGDSTWFVATESGYIQGVWKVDGSTSDPVLVKGGFWNISDLIVKNTGLYFLANQMAVSSTPELWRIDFQSNQATLVKEFPSQNSVDNFFTSGNNLYFQMSGETNHQLWISNGTTEGTFIFKEIEKDEGYLVFEPLSGGTKTFFTRVASQSKSLWLTDGTENGTTLVKEVTGEIQYMDVITGFGESLFFYFVDGSKVDLWVTDGTIAGTISIGKFPFYLGQQTVVGRQLFFTIDSDGTQGRQLWVTDGTIGGTRMLKEVSGVYLGCLIGSHGKVFFSIGDGVMMPQLWMSDGTIPGTVMVTDFSAPKFASGGMYPERLLHFDGKNYFFLLHGVFLWKTDGTEAGTEMVKNLGQVER